MDSRNWRRLPRIGGHDVDADVRAEIEAHLDMQIHDLLAAGYSPERARWEALRRFGDLDGVKREMQRIDRAMDRQTRRTQRMEDIGLDVRQALRQLMRRPLFGLIVIIIIALGIGANAAVFAVVDGALLRPLPLHEGDDLVYLFEGATTEDGSHPTLAEFRAYERDRTFLQGVTGSYSTGFTVHAATDPELVIGGVLTGDPEIVFGLAPVIGRWFTSDEVRSGARVVMLDEGYWRSRFGGSERVLGAPLRVNGESFVIIGVLPGQANLLSPGSPVSLWTTLREEPWMAGELHFLRTLGRLAPGIDIAQATTRAASLATAVMEQNIGHEQIQLVRLRDRLVGDVRALLMLVFAAVLSLLLIVCANVANLFLARSLERGREFAVRASLGAGRWRLLRQIMTEGLVLGILGGAGGLLLSQAFVSVIGGLSANADALAPASGVDARVVAFTLLLSLLTGLLFSVWPALRAGRLDLGSAIRDGDTRMTSGRAAWTRRRALVAMEVGLCVLLLAGAGVLARSMWRVLHEHPGFNADNTLITGLALRGDGYTDDETLVRTFGTYLERVHALPGVVAAGYGSNIPLDGGDTSGAFGIVGNDYAEGEEPFAKKRVVTSGYFTALGIPLLAGRSFDDRDRLGQPDVAIISQSAARRYFGDENPIGRRITFNWGPGDAQTVIGIVGDIKHDGLDRPIEPIIYRPATQFPHRGFALVVRTAGEPHALMSALRRELRAVDPTQALFEPRTMEMSANDSLATRRTFMTLMLGFALMALLLTIVGVYAICAQSVSARTREMGVRIALGATPASIVGQVLRTEMRTLAVGLAGGIAVAIPAARALSSAVYGISPHDPTTFAATLITLGLAGIAATLIPARRVARLDVVTIIRGN